MLINCLINSEQIVNNSCSKNQFMVNSWINSWTLMFQKTVLSPFVLRPPSLRLFDSSTLRLFDSLTLWLFLSLSLWLFDSSSLRPFDSLTLSLFLSSSLRLFDSSSLRLLSYTVFSLPHKKRGLTSKSLSFDAMSCVYAAVRLSKLVTGRHFKDVLWITE